MKLTQNNVPITNAVADAKILLEKARAEKVAADLTKDDAAIAAAQINIHKATADLALVKAQQEAHNQMAKGDSFPHRLRADLFPELEERFRIFRDAHGVEVLYAVGIGNEVTLQAKPAALAEKIYEWVAASPWSNKALDATDEALGIWTKETKKLFIEPALVKFDCQDPDDYTFRRLPFHPEPGPIDAWEEFDSRLADAKVWRAWVWSIFEAKNKGRQTMWIKGEGEDGKSEVIKALRNAMGLNGCAAITGAAMGDTKFLAASCYGKRFVVYADCKNPKFAMTEFHRNLTSDDPVSINGKNQALFTGSMRCKVLVASNTLPDITGQSADISRLIVMPISESANKDDPTWGDRLAAQLPAYLNACWLAYEELCPNHGKIKLTPELGALVKERAEEFEESFEFFFEDHFVLDPTAKTERSYLFRLAKEEWGKDSSTKLGDFKKWLGRQPGVRVDAKSGPTRKHLGFRPRIQQQPSQEASEQSSEVPF